MLEWTQRHCCFDFFTIPKVFIVPTVFPEWGERNFVVEFLKNWMLLLSVKSASETV